MEQAVNVYITETLSKKIIIKANSIEEAYDIADDMYKHQRIVLTADDFVEHEIEVEEK